MSYTLLRVTSDGAVLHDEHLRRLAPAGAAIADAFRAFAREATPGVYALRAEGSRLLVERREASRLEDGMPVRYAISPFAGRAGSFPKPAPPCAYDPLRLPGICTLLTTADGEEILEACSAAVIGWDGRQLILPPADRPRVASTAEAGLRARRAFVESPIRRRERRPLAVVNAVKGLCVIHIPGRDPFPPAACRIVAAALRATTRR